MSEKESPSEIPFEFQSIEELEARLATVEQAMGQLPEPIDQREMRKLSLVQEKLAVLIALRKGQNVTGHKLPRKHGDY